MREQVLDMCELSRKESLAVLRELVDDLELGLFSPDFPYLILRAAQAYFPQDEADLTRFVSLAAGLPDAPVEMLIGGAYLGKRDAFPKLLGRVLREHDAMHYMDEIKR